MKYFAGVLIEGSTVPVDELSRRLDAVSAPGAAHGEPVFVLVPLSGDFLNRIECVARASSQLARSAFALFADGNSDNYIVARYESGTCARRIGFFCDNEDDSQWDLIGEPEGWEADLLFALPVDNFVAYLSCDERYTDADLDRARSAHQAHDLTALARRPPLYASSLWAWLKSRGVDPHTPHATLRSPTFWRRLFGRRVK